MSSLLLLVEEHIGMRVLHGESVDLATVAVVVLVPLLIEMIARIGRVVATVGAAVVAYHRT